MISTEVRSTINPIFVMLLDVWSKVNVAYIEEKNSLISSDNGYWLDVRHPKPTVWVLELRGANLVRYATARFDKKTFSVKLSPEFYFTCKLYRNKPVINILADKTNYSVLDLGEILGTQFGLTEDIDISLFYELLVEGFRIQEELVVLYEQTKNK